jgi:hypothetical protein
MNDTRNININDVYTEDDREPRAANLLLQARRHFFGGVANRHITINVDILNKKHVIMQNADVSN